MQGKALIAAAVSMALSAGAWGGAEGASSTYYGQGAGAAADPATGNNTYIGFRAGKTANNAFSNTFVGFESGESATSGGGNTYVGISTGRWTTTGILNTAIGSFAGGNVPMGDRNVFLGYSAGFSESGSNKLYIDNCYYSGVPLCSHPFIKGDLAARLLEIDGVLGVTANRVIGSVKSQLHFSVSGADEGGWLTSAAENNFFTSSGARYDAPAGGWIQRSSDGKAVIAGSGAVGFRVLTSSGGAVGSPFVPVARLHIDYDGLMGVNTAPVAGRAINTSTGAYLSSGGVWVNASSRALKEDVARLSSEDALQAFAKLEPVRFRYKNDADAHVGFIAEDVPALVATNDRKGVSAMEVVALLTKVVQGQADEIAQMRQRHNGEIAEMRERLRQLESRAAQQ